MKKLNLSTLSFAMIALSQLASCGGGSDGPSCGTFAACGGDVVGNWSIAQSCGLASSVQEGFKEFCPSATVDTSGLSITGTIAFKADKTYSTSTVMGGKMVIRLPASCLSSGGITLTCSQLSMAAMNGDSEDTFSSLSCTGSSSCDCTATLKSQTDAEYGTYAVAHR